MRTRAVILKKQNTGEYDQLVTCYTEEFGKLTAVAKSVLKPNSIQAMHLDVFNLVDFELINGRATPIIAGAQAENTYPNMKSNLSFLATAYFFTEVIDRIAFDYQQDEKLWNFLVSLLDGLNHDQSSRSLASGRLGGGFLRVKQLELLDILGYAPNLTECAFCAKVGSGELAVYNVQARGIVCKDCFLSGREGIVIKPVRPDESGRLGGNNNFLSGPVLNSIFESLAERKLNSLNFLNYMLESRQYDNF